MAAPVKATPPVREPTIPFPDSATLQRYLEQYPALQEIRGYLREHRIFQDIAALFAHRVLTKHEVAEGVASYFLNKQVGHFQMHPLQAQLMGMLLAEAAAWYPRSGRMPF